MQLFEVAAPLVKRKQRGLCEWARRHVSQRRAHPRSCYLPVAPEAPAAPFPFVALGALDPAVPAGLLSVSPAA